MSMLCLRYCCFSFFRFLIFGFWSRGVITVFAYRQCASLSFHLLLVLNTIRLRSIAPWKGPGQAIVISSGVCRAFALRIIIILEFFLRHRGAEGMIAMRPVRIMNEYRYQLMSPSPVHCRSQSFIVVTQWPYPFPIVLCTHRYPRWHSYKCVHLLIPKNYDKHTIYVRRKCDRDHYYPQYIYKI